ncbi:DNA-directed RNA polymerase subunit alpha [Patescibacteria group bacterium]|nr:DNA-directed RNA polymerase subunit alpha [Patescibacteria group bacterium]
MSIPLPTTTDIKELKNSRAQVTIEPCYPGYGVTLGNALRRVLLSSIEGAAISSFKVKGTQHEFSTLPNIKEDLIEIMLNLKQVRVKVFSDEPVVLSLKVKGEKTVTAADIEKNSAIEIVDPEQPILTITDAKGEVEMEMIAQKGYGYVTVEEREKEKVDIGTIMIDAIYSPLVNVGFEIENVRVGEQTNYEKLILKIETDKTITPRQALEKAALVLNEHLSLLISKDAAKQSVKEPKQDQEIEEKVKEEPAETAPDNTPVEEEKPKRKRGRPKKVKSDE